MSEAPTKLTRLHKLLLASLATVTLSLGAVGVVSAAQSPATTSDTPAVSDEADGLECENGLDAATGAPCTDDDAVEGDNGEADEADGGAEVDGVDCVDGIDAATGAECDGGPAANHTDGADDGEEDGETADQ